MFGGLTGWEFLFWGAQGGLSAEGAREAAIAEGKKPLTTRGVWGSVVSSPAGSGVEPQKPM